MQAFWILLASLLFATMSMLIKIAAADFTLVEIVFFRTLPGTLLLLGYARARRLELAPRHWKIHLVRNVTGIVAMFLAFYATAHVSLALATSLEYTAPLFLMLYVMLLSHHRPRVAEIVALVGGFAGVMLLLQPTLRDNQLWPSLSGLTAGALAAIAYLQIRRLGRAGESAWRIVFYYSLAGTLVSLAALPSVSGSTYSWHGLATLAGIGVTGLSAQLAMTRGFTHGSPTRASTLQFSTVAFAAIYGYALWGDRLSWIGGSGLVLVVASGLVAVSNSASAAPGSPPRGRDRQRI